MEMINNKLRSILEKLPEDLKKEVLDYAEFLMERYKRRKKKGFKFDWEGALSELKDKFTSVDLQHKVLEWRE